MARLPQVLGTLSDATKIKFSSIDSTITELMEQPVITENFDTLGAWTETDADGKVNLVANVVQMDGGGAINTHGIYYTAGVPRAEGYFEIKSIIPNTTNGLYFGFNNSGALAWVVSGTMSWLTKTALYALPYAGAEFVAAGVPGTAGTYYTLRIHIKKSAFDGVSWKYVKHTIQGGTEFPNETPVFCCDRVTTEIGATIYPVIQRYANSPANLAYVKEFKWYSGYVTDGSGYTDYVHDAGAGKVFDNFDPTSLALPGTVPSTNLTFKWSFDDGVASYSAALTLAQLNAVGKQTAQHRYIRLRVINGSDGPTQCYGAEPNSDTATDGVFDSDMITPEQEAARNISAGASNILAGAHEHIQGAQINGTSDKVYSLAEADAYAEEYAVLYEDSRNSDNGTVAADLAAGKSVRIKNVLITGSSDKLYSAAEEQARNTPLAAKYQNGEHFQKWGVDTTGSYAGSLVAPSAPVLGTPEIISATHLRIYFTWASGATKIYLERSTDGATWGTPVEMAAGVYSYNDTTVVANTTYYYRARSWNDAGYSAYCSNVYAKTPATASIPATNPESELLISVRAAILEIEDGGAAVFASKDVVIGEFAASDTDENGDDQKDLTNKEPEDFPCVEISPIKFGGRGKGYESQRNIVTGYGVRIALHQYKTTPDRVTGADIKSLSLLGSAILRQMFRLTDKAGNATPPCPGFLWTEPEFDSWPEYELISQHINTEIIEVRFRADVVDTEI